MTHLPPDHEAMLTAWQQHTHAEFLLKDPDAALATMTDNPYVICVPSGTGGVGRAAVRKFYAEKFLPSIPPDFELQSLSQIFSNDAIVEEFVVRFTHTLRMDWMLPGVRPTGRKAEFVIVAIIRFQAGKVAREHVYWDQATALSQLGVLDKRVAAAGAGSAAHLVRLSVLPVGPTRDRLSLAAPVKALTT
jgi:carboxymethylenebutenolidase